MNNYNEILKKYLSFKTISTDKKYLPEIFKCAKFLKELLEKNKFKTKIINGYGNPLVFGEFNNKSKETVLLYGHYDVQPASKEEGWRTDPFTLTEDKKKFYGRGVVDNKGQTLIHLFTFFQLLKENKLGYNLKIILEGNEETGSEKLKEFLKSYKELLKADFILISDGEIVDNLPIIDAGFRGVVNLEIHFQTANREFHSGLYGGVVPNSAQETLKILKTIFGESNKILIKDFYREVEKISSELIRNNKRLPFNQKRFIKETGVKRVFTEDFDFYTKTGLLPTIQITGLKSGYLGDGFRNSVPSLTIVKLNIRFVEKQKPEKIIKIFENHLKKVVPDYVSWKIKAKEIAPGAKVDLNNKYVEKAKHLLKEVFKKEPVFKFSGGTLPIVAYFKNILKIPQVLVPLANEDCNMHAANENFDKKLVAKGLEFSYLFFKK